MNKKKIILGDFQATYKWKMYSFSTMVYGAMSNKKVFFCCSLIIYAFSKLGNSKKMSGYKLTGPSDFKRNNKTNVFNNDLIDLCYVICEPFLKIHVFYF